MSFVMKQDIALDMLQVGFFSPQAEVFKSGDNASFFKQFWRCRHDVRLQL